MTLPSSLTRAFPFLVWLPRSNRKTLRADLVAGLSVALVAIPQSLAYAQLAGLPPYYGLYSALVPTLVGALWGNSAQLSTGPVAMTSLLTAASIAPFASSGSPEYIFYAITIALLSGAFQVGFGLMRLGVLMNLLSHPVLMGFINAAAILIALAQVPTLFGVPPPKLGHALIDTWHVLSNLHGSHGHSVVFSVVAIAALIGFRRYAPRLPGVLITVAVLTAVSYEIDYAGYGGRIVGDIPRGLPAFALPGFNLDAWIEMLPAGFVIAVISFMEAMSSSKIAAIKTSTKWDENQELIGQGLAKIAAALSQTMPVSGSFSRSALNLAAGARTALSSVICGLCVLATLLFFTPLLKYLPLPVLGAIIVMALTGLINVRSLRNAWRASRDDAIAAVLTFVATIAFAPQIQNGIFTGILVALGLFVYRRMRPAISVVEPDSEALARELPEALHETLLHGALGIIRFDASLVFVNASYFEDAVARLQRQHPRLRFVLVSASGINHLDASGVEMLAGLAVGLEKNDIKLTFSRVKPQVMSVLERTGLAARIGAENFFARDQFAFAALAARLGPEG